MDVSTNSLGKSSYLFYAKFLCPTLQLPKELLSLIHCFGSRLKALIINRTDTIIVKFTMRLSVPFMILFQRVMVYAHLVIQSIKPSFPILKLMPLLLKRINAFQVDVGVCHDV